MSAPVHRLALPTPFLVGRVNCWLVDDDPLTLFDCGPNSGKALHELEQGLARHGRRIEDVERLVLTHQHVDHLGLAQVVAERSDCEVVALDLLAPMGEQFGRYMRAEDERAERLMVRHGVPEETAAVLRTVGRLAGMWGTSVQVGRVVRDGEVLEGAQRSWRVLHRPGHSPTDTVFVDEADGTAIGGDHLLGRISSNPVVTWLHDAPEDPRPHALEAYVDSLQRTAALDLRVVHPGHGDDVHEHRTLVDERLRLHERRAGKVLGRLQEGPVSAYAVAKELWGKVAVAQAYLALSEVLGHFDLLTARGEAHEVDGDAPGTRLLAAGPDPG